jgi:single-stranded-DNA-specific exonuclease
VTEWLAKKHAGAVSDLEIRGKKIPKVIVQILHNRGYDTSEKIEAFFAPSLNRLHDPFLLGDMERAVDRIITAQHTRESVLVHGDFDTDGITGVALIMHNLKKCGIEVTEYIPQRLVEGYGLSRGGVNRAIERGCGLIISVDCGITAIDEIAHANENNIDVIVCDHHKPKETLPNAYAILDPKVPGDRYPFKELAGVGVAFKMLQALYQKLGRPQEELFEDLDLVALGSVVDVVPLVEENRILVKHGIRRIPKTQKVGIQALLEETGLKSGLTAYHLAFIIGPRINACGRLRDAQEALELLLTHDPSRAAGLARNLSQDNITRQEVENAIYQDARHIIEREARHRDRVILVGNDTWHEGVIGIVASRIVEDFYRPTILLALKEEIAKGSARSIKNFDITDALHGCADLLIKFGGHSQAAGLEVHRTHIDELRECINNYARHVDERTFEKQSTYDIKLDLNDITDEVM